MPDATGAPRGFALARDDPDYPTALRDLRDAPDLLYGVGSSAGWPRAIAIVGSRAATPYGIEQARRLASDLAGHGFAIVSGLARGIDQAAHRAALDAGGRTIAVLPGGADVVTPSHHRALAASIAERGAVISEHPPGTSVRGGMFVTRNRLIAALGLATVVVEAAERSGALSTAAAARRLGRPCFAVPGDVDRPASRGCHALIRQGARLCEGAGDVVAVVGAGSPAGDRLLAALDDEPRGVEGLAERAGIGLAEALAGLLRLEWEALAVSLPGQRWKARRS